MRKLLGLTAAIALTAGMMSTANAIVVTNLDDAPQAWAASATADPTGLPTGATWTAAPSIRNGNDSGVYRSPWDDEDVVGGDNTGYFDQDYFAVGPNNPTNPAILDFGDNTETYFRMLWGSVDSYNEIAFYNDDGLVATVTNTDIVPGAGNASGRGASFVQFTDVTFDEIRFFSDGQNALEWANMSTTPVPIPAAVWLFGSAVLGLFGVGYKRKAAA
jgi:hypothetical protein